MTVVIPKHLQANRVVGGLPVPHVVSTTRGHHVLRRVHPLDWGFDVDYVIEWQADNDTPDFAKYDEAKQRESVLGRLCHVCWKKPHSLLLCLPTGVTQTIVFGTGDRPYPLVKQPWVCFDCLAFAARHCPPLRSAIAARTGWVAHVTSHRAVKTFWQPVTQEDPAPPPGAKVLSYIKIAVLDAKWAPLHEWIKSGFAAPYASPQLPEAAT